MHYAHMILQRCVEQFFEQDYTTTALLYAHAESEMLARIQRMIEEGRFDAVLLLSVDLPTLTTVMDEREVPYLFANPAHPHRRNAVMFDEDDNVRLAFKALIEAGHTQIGYLDFTKARDPHLTVMLRRNAYIDLCHRHHLPPHFFSEDFADIESVRTPADLRNLPAGVLTYSMDLAQKFLSRVYRNRHINPTYFSVIAAAEDVYQDRTPQRIAGVSLPIDVMADAIVENLLHRIAHKGQDAANRKVSGTLAIRETIHPAAHAHRSPAAKAGKPPKK